MSVWKGTTYKLDIARAIYEHLNGAHETILGARIGKYLIPKRRYPDLDANSTWDDVADECGWEPLAGNEDLFNTIVTKAKKVGRWSIGIEGVYQVVYAVYTSESISKPQYPYEALAVRVKEIGKYLAASSLIPARIFNEEWNACDGSALGTGIRFENASEGIKYLVRNLDPKNDEIAKVKLKGYIGEDVLPYRVDHIGPLIVFWGQGGVANQAIILLRQHLNFLVEALMRLANLNYHTAYHYPDDVVLRMRITKMMELCIFTAKRARRINSHRVVEAFHKARAYAQMLLFDNIMENALAEARTEYSKKNLQDILPLSLYLSVFEGLPRAQWLEVLHVYKWMPPPDFDSTLSFAELYGYHTTTRESGLDATSSDEAKLLWEAIELERKLNLAYAIKRMYATWPSALEIHHGTPTKESLEAWDYTGTIPYYTYGTDVVAQIKDKATVSASIDEEMAGRVPKEQSSFLLWYLTNVANIDTVADANSLAAGCLHEDNYARVAYKGEAHKPGSRLFFMAPPRQRILLGELEGNLSRIAQFYPGSLQGVDSMTKGQRLARLFDIYDPSDDAAISSVTTCYVVTFDLAKFSPRFNPAVLKDLHRFWAKVFSYPAINSMARIGALGEIVHTTGGLRMRYQNRGADLEGFRGRMMTFFHADLLAAACRLGRREGYIEGKSTLAVFIDDGAVRINAVGEGDEAKANALNFLNCMQKVYAAAGQENHPNKTIVSAIGGELLAEQFLHGQRMKCPLKAAMRLYPDYDKPAISITEEFDALFSTVQGSVRDGGKWVKSLRALANAYVKTIYRWERHATLKLDVCSFALRVIAPRAIGGFGFPSLQALVSTSPLDSTSEGLGILNAACRMYPAISTRVGLLVARGVIEKSPLQMLKDPTTIRLDCDHIVEGRLVNALLEKIARSTKPYATTLKGLDASELVTHAEAVAIAVLERPDISLPVLKRIWECTPLAYAEKTVQKFDRAATIMAIMTPGDIAGVRRKNISDVRKLLTKFP